MATDPCGLQFAGALHHITAPGDERRDILLGNATDDRGAFLETLKQTCDRFNWMLEPEVELAKNYNYYKKATEENRVIH